MSQIGISFSNTPTFIVYEEELTSWFPNIHGYSVCNVINGDRLVSDLENRLSRHIQEYTRTEKIRMSLRHLFDIFKSRGVESNAAGLHAIMQGLLQHDMLDRFTSGLKETRQRFLVLCAFAHQMHSEGLAAALVGFLSNYILVIAEAEDPYLLHSWCLGIHELRGLISEHVLAQLLSHLMDLRYDSRGKWHDAQFPNPWTMAAMMSNLMDARHVPFIENHRGRRLAVPEATGWGHRARSLPSGRHHRLRSPDWQVGRARIPHSNWGSPVMSPIPYAFSGYFDELKAVEMEQNAQSIEVDDLQRRVRLLELGA